MRVGPAWQYSPLATKYDPLIVAESFDFCRANLNFVAGSSGGTVLSDSFNRSERCFGGSRVSRLLIDSPLSWNTYALLMFSTCSIVASSGFDAKTRLRSFARISCTQGTSW